MQKLFWPALLAAFAAMAAPAYAQTANFVEKHGDWSVYAHGEGADKVCFAVAQPRSKKPDNVKRGPVYYYVSSWPAETVTNEINVKMGYPLKEGVPVEVKIGDAQFNLFTKDEGAWVQSSDEEQKAVAAMKAGAVMFVQGRSSRGTLTTDEYSLNGVTAAIEAANKNCQ